jgi:hypothetical protein
LLCDSNRLLTYKDLQTILHVGKSRAYELLKSDCFPTIKINNRYYVSQKHLEKWIDTYSGKTFLV